MINKPRLITSVPYLNAAAILQAIAEVRQKYSGEALLEEMQEKYMAFAEPPEIKFIRPSRGILLYGPPGTGKTTLTYSLPSKMGFLPMAPPLAAAEVNRPYVGQTEALLMDLLSRAHRFPHLLCTISVDEIDGLAPRRDDKSSQSKVDALSVLLSYVGGIKDVPNLVFFGSTNRIKMMDTAFLRRLNEQFFVGRPGPAARLKLLSRCQESFKSQGSPVILDNKGLQNLTIWTTNFSGAALDILVSDLIVYANRKLKPANRRTFTPSEMLKLAHRVSNQFNLSIGSTSLAAIFNELLTHKINNLDSFVSDSELSLLHTTHTGLVVADLKSRQWIIESKTGKYNIQKENGPSNIKELLSICAQFAADVKLDSIQLFDLDLLLANAAYDDTKAAEIIQEKLDEILKYPMAMAIIDLDSVVGLSDNETSSSTGLSSSSSVANMKMYSLLLNIASKRQVSIHLKPVDQRVTKSSRLIPYDKGYWPEIEEETKDEVTNSQFWVVIASSNPFLLKRVYNEKMTKKTAEQESDEAKAEQESKEKHRCVFCGIDYTISDNDKMNCSYHDGDLFYPAEDKDLWRQISPELVPLEAGRVYQRKKNRMVRVQSDLSASSNVPPDFSSELTNFKYLCCLVPFSGAKGQGCCKGYHLDINECPEALRDEVEAKRETYKQKLDSLRRVLS